jgi:hypothetical protein
LWTPELSKVVSVLGPERGFQIVEEGGAAAHVVRKPNGEIEERQTPNFAGHIHP